MDDTSKYKTIKSRTIKNEINRFESVHPCIYEIYDLLDQISELKVSHQIREFVHSIEDSFINSQEWTMPHGIHEIRIGLLGASCSGKSSLIHRYLTGTYIQNEYDEGGRFKKEVLFDGDDSHLVMIRDDGSEPPDSQFSNWVDGVIFVFSLENEDSLNLLYKLHAKLVRLRSSVVGTELPCILVGTQDYISESNPRVIDELRARKLASDLNMCAYYETCATYGLNVEKVFQEAAISLEHIRVKRCQKEMSSCLQQRSMNIGNSYPLQSNQNALNVPSFKSKVNTQTFMSSKLDNVQKHSYNQLGSSPPAPPMRDSSQAPMLNYNVGAMKANVKKSVKENSSNGMGIGRAIPIKQGLLYKRKGDKTLAKERTKKYVTLSSDSKLVYHAKRGDYIENVHAKEIDLSKVTVKIPGIVYRHGAGRVPTMGSGVTVPALKSSRDRSSDPTGNLKGLLDMTKKVSRKISTNDSDLFEFQIVSLDGKQWSFDAGSEEEREEWVTLIEQAILECIQNLEINRCPGMSNLDDSIGIRTDCDNYNKRISTVTECGEATSESESRKRMIQEITAVSGNMCCADCGQPKPDWASLNLGTLLCIECSGVHRRLGTHISRVRSLQLDQWTSEWQAVMKAIGNTVANTVWEAAVNVNPRNLSKPEPSSSSKEKEEWIRSKYERREFLPPLPCPGWPIQQQLIDAISRRDIRQVILCLAIASELEINANDPRAPIHIAAANGDIVCLQMLIWYKGEVELKDINGRNSYFYAMINNHNDAAEFLFKNGCSRQLLTCNSQIPILITGNAAAPNVPKSLTDNTNLQYNTLSRKGLFISPKDPVTNSR